MTHPATPDPEVAVPAELLRDVQTVLAGATEQLARVGWRRTPPARPDSGARLVDALKYSSAYAAVGQRAYEYAFACAAMAIELHTSYPAWQFLGAFDADAYLSDETPDETLHALDVKIIDRYNAGECTGADDALALLRVAFENAEQVVAAQIAHRDCGTAGECLNPGACLLDGPQP